MWVIKCLYSVNIVISITLQAFPANIIMEGYFYSGMKRGPLKDWVINIQRTIIVGLCVAICIFLGDSLDKFNSLIGTVVATPVVFTVPCLMHLKLCSPSKGEKVLDIAVIMFSLVVLFFCSGFTLYTWKD